MNNSYLDNKVREGTIYSFTGNSDDGLAHLNVDGLSIPCENALTAIKLHAYFGNFIVKGKYDENAVIGKKVRCKVDESGVLEDFVPIDLGLEIN